MHDIDTQRLANPVVQVYARRHELSVHDRLLRNQGVELCRWQLNLPAVDATPANGNAGLAYSRAVSGEN